MLFEGFGVGPTPEQVEEYKKQVAEATAKGNMNFMTLPLFNPDRKCVKCGHHKPAKVTHMHFCDNRTIRAIEAAGDHEVMIRQCRRCGYIWFERTLSEEPC